MQQLPSAAAGRRLVLEREDGSFVIRRITYASGTIRQAVFRCRPLFAINLQEHYAAILIPSVANGATVSGKDLKRLFLAHGQEIQAFLQRKLRDVDLAADLTQETFIRFAQRSGEAAVVDDKFYLYRTAHNLAIDHVRARQRRRTVSTSPDQLADIREDRPSVEEAFAAREELDRLESIVRELPLLTRRIFLLTRVKGMTHAATAEFLGISPSSVQKHLNQALNHVIRRLKAQAD